MNDLPYILYRAAVMLVDTMDMDHATELAHRRLCDFIWAHERAPRNDNEILRQITRTAATDWGRVRRGLECKGWFESGPFLVHRGAITSLNESSGRAAENFNRTAVAGNRPAKVAVTDQVTGIVSYKLGDAPVTPSVTPSVTPPVTGDVTAGQEEKERKSKTYSLPQDPLKAASSGGSGGVEPPWPEIPSELAFRRKAEMLGLPEWRWRDAYLKLEEHCWCDPRTGRRIGNWSRHLERVHGWWVRDGSPLQPPGRPGATQGPNGAQIVVWQRELEACEKAIRDLRPEGLNQLEGDDAKRMAALKARRKELREKLAIKA